MNEVQERFKTPDYILKDQHGNIIAAIAIKAQEQNAWFEGSMITCNTDAETPLTEDVLNSCEYFGEFIIKWDGCSHWHFHGQKLATTLETDAYYHLCGADDYVKHCAYLWFAWKCAENYYMDAKNVETPAFDELGGMGAFDSVFEDCKIIKL